MAYSGRFCSSTDCGVKRVYHLAGAAELEMLSHFRHPNSNWSPILAQTSWTRTENLFD